MWLQRLFVLASFIAHFSAEGANQVWTSNIGSILPNSGHQTPALIGRTAQDQISPLRRKKIIKKRVHRIDPTSEGAFQQVASNRTMSDARFLSLFTVVRFRNEACMSGAGFNGTCYTATDCSGQGGTSSGSCAQGFGVCCIFTKTCGQTTNTNGTYFQNGGYPSTYSTVGSCQLTVEKCNDNICQLRLDFEHLNLNQPDSVNNVCQYDQFIVSGASSPIPAICGSNTGQHMYVDLGLSRNSPVTLTVVTSGASSNARSFSVKITQYQCMSLESAPEGCLQYFQGITGTLMSFNYLGATGLMLSNTDYSICIRAERNFCGIQYSTCTDTANVQPTTPFQLTANSAMSFSITGGQATQGSVVGTNCANDWIQIPCATNTMDIAVQQGTPSACVDRICGMVFNSVTTPSGSPSVPVNSFVKPFIVHVHTNAVEGSSIPAESNNRGFCLKYTQQPCTASG